MQVRNNFIFAIKNATLEMSNTENNENQIQKLLSLEQTERGFGKGIIRQLNQVV